MHAPGEPYAELIRPLYERAAASLPGGIRWFDAHTHIGHDDPDGYEADPGEILAGLDRAGQHRALLFPMHEPSGYPPANDRVLEACAASAGRLLPLGRVDPNAPDALDEVRRVLDAGARGIKLHPRSDGFGLPHPVVEALVPLVAERRGIVLFHAGRGIPHLGETVGHLARDHPGASLILAHAGISELGWIAPVAAELPNLLFDTAWWQIGDLLALFATIPPARIVYGSDMPYGSSLFHAFAFLRCAAAVGLGEDALVSIAGGQLGRVVGGEEPIELGPAPGGGGLGPRDPGFERVVAHLASACQLSFRLEDPTEPLALARLACQRLDDHPAAAVVDELLERTQEAVAGAPPEVRPRAVIGALCAQVIAGTPHNRW